MEWLSIRMLSKALRNALARLKHRCLVDSLGLEGKKKWRLIVAVERKKR